MIVATMNRILLEDLDPDTTEKLRLRARRHGCSIATEAREILRHAVLDEGMSPSRLGTRIAARFSGLGLDEEIPEISGRDSQPVDFSS